MAQPRSRGRGIGLTIGKIGMNSTIYPTHTCFDDAIGMLTEFAETKCHNHLRLVHGILDIPESSVGLSAHAWVEEWLSDERKWIAWSEGFTEDGNRARFAVYKDEYYKELSVTSDVTRYTIDDLLKENFKSGHYGPWLDRYRALTKEGKGNEVHTLRRKG